MDERGKQIIITKIIEYRYSPDIDFIQNFLKTEMNDFMNIVNSFCAIEYMKDILTVTEKKQRIRS